VVDEFVEAIEVDLEFFFPKEKNFFNIFGRVRLGNVWKVLLDKATKSKVIEIFYFGGRDIGECLDSFLKIQRGSIGFL